MRMARPLNRYSAVDVSHGRSLNGFARGRRPLIRQTQFAKLQLYVHSSPLSAS
jgi:hypothetical protein